MNLYFFQYSPQAEQGTVKTHSEYGEAPNLDFHVKTAVRNVLSSDFNLTRKARQISHGDSLLGGYHSSDKQEHPLHEPTGEKTRKTFDFTSEWMHNISENNDWNETFLCVICISWVRDSFFFIKGLSTLGSPVTISKQLRVPKHQAFISSTHLI